MKKVLITGSNGFVGKNLQLHLAERKDVEVLCFTRQSDVSQLPSLLEEVDFVFHLAGVNRPQDPAEFAVGNANLTQLLCKSLSAVVADTGRKIPVIFTSSTQAENGNPYGKSKCAAELALFETGRVLNTPIHIFRLPNVFGKWCKPNYNSVVATFCCNLARNQNIQINDPKSPLTLVYVDDVIERFIQIMDGAESKYDKNGFEVVQPQFTTTVGDLADQIKKFKNSRESLMSERVGSGLTRALYSTYLSYLPEESFAYKVPQHSDPRGVFVEMLKTPDSGQFSYFTAHPGITRGGHYHHTKTEKFLVIKGQARFKFRHMQTGQTHELVTSDAMAEVVETVPGWTHDITNIGPDEMVVMLWANEVFDRARPDTFACPL